MVVLATMQAAKMILCLLGVCFLAPEVSCQTTPAAKRMVIGASAVLDGRGRVLHDTRIVIEGSNIVAVDANAGPVDYDLRGLTVLPDGSMRMPTLPGVSGRMARMQAWLGRRKKTPINRRRMPG